MTAAARGLTLAGSALAIVGVLLPFVDFDDGSGAWSLLDSEALVYTFPFAVEPLVVAVVAPFVAFLFSRLLAGIVLTTVGAQTLLMFGGMAFGPLFGGYEVGLGGPVGMAGAACIAVGGLLLLTAEQDRAAAGEPLWDGASPEASA